MIGTTLGSYRIVRELGIGGMGVVFYAEHPIIGKRAAIKVLRPEYSKDREVIDRFFNEARAVSTIHDPGLVDIYDFGFAPDGSGYIVMEFLDGESLAARLSRGPIARELAVAIVRQLASVLAVVHANHIVHRDLKPDNVFLCPDPAVAIGLRAKVLDFGIAKLLRSDPRHDHPSHTQTGVMMGTPIYMAPEQCRGAREIDHRADIYALGVMLYELACGRVPFTGDGIGELIAKHQYEPPPPPRQVAPAVPVPLEALILKMLAKQPGDRPQSMADVIAALDRDVDLAVAATLRPVEPSPALGRPQHATVTTLSGATGVSAAPPPRSRTRAVVAGVVAAVGVAGGVVAVRMASTHGDAAAASTATSAEPAEPSVPAPPPVPAQVTIRVDSVPPGADVYTADSVRLGKTPLHRTIERSDGTVVYTLKLAGYVDKTVEVAAGSDGATTATLAPVPTAPNAANAPNAPNAAAKPLPPHPRPRPPAPAATPTSTEPQAVNPFEKKP